MLITKLPTEDLKDSSQAGRTWLNPFALAWLPLMEYPFGCTLTEDKTVLGDVDVKSTTLERGVFLADFNATGKLLVDDIMYHMKDSHYNISEVCLVLCLCL